MHADVMAISDTQVTKSQLDGAWKLAAQAVRYWHQHQTELARETMLDAVEYAQGLEELYDEQYEQWVTS